MTCCLSLIRCPGLDYEAVSFRVCTVHMPVACPAVPSRLLDRTLIIMEHRLKRLATVRSDEEYYFHWLTFVNTSRPMGPSFR
jgi:hypothetical protein